MQSVLVCGQAIRLPTGCLESALGALTSKVLFQVPVLNLHSSWGTRISSPLFAFFFILAHLHVVSNMTWICNKRNMMFVGTFMPPTSSSYTYSGTPCSPSHILSSPPNRLLLQSNSLAGTEGSCCHTSTRVVAHCAQCSEASVVQSQIVMSETPS